jgi:hypothetical protein
MLLSAANIKFQPQTFENTIHLGAKIFKQIIATVSAALNG